MQQDLVSYSDGAFALALQILGNRADAEDAVQDAFVKVIRARFDPARSSMRTFFFRIVRNAAIDLRRKRQDGLNDIEELADQTNTPEQHAEAAEASTTLYRALDQLNDSQRDIVLLKDYLGFSYAEIAQVMEIAEGTVMSRLHRARLTLRDHLAHWHDHEKRSSEDTNDR